MVLEPGHDAQGFERRLRRIEWDERGCGRRRRHGSDRMTVGEVGVGNVELSEDCWYREVTEDGGRVKEWPGAETFVGANC